MGPLISIVKLYAKPVSFLTVLRDMQQNTGWDTWPSILPLNSEANKWDLRRLNCVMVYEDGWSSVGKRRLRGFHHARMVDVGTGRC